MATSDSLLRESPALSAESATEVARLRFGLDGRASPLTSERDQNFLISVGGRPRAVLKIASVAEDRGKDLGFAKIDNHRSLRRGFPEVIFENPRCLDAIQRRVSSYPNA